MRNFARLLGIARRNDGGAKRLRVSGPDVSVTRARVAARWRLPATARYLGEFVRGMHTRGLYLDALTWHHYYARPTASEWLSAALDMSLRVGNQSASFIHPIRDERPGACLFSRNFCEYTHSRIEARTEPR